MTTRERVYASLLATGGDATERHAIYPRRLSDASSEAPKRESMRPTGVRKMPVYRNVIRWDRW